ncbi:thioredoxin-like protein, partial [Russula dissimulans]
TMSPNQDTEFDEALRKHGILPPRELTPPTPSPPSSPTLDDILEDLTPAELQRLGEDVQDDAVERQIAQRRTQRLVEERLEARRRRFGTVIPIGRDDYTREVTEASKEDETGDAEARGTGVVCFLYKDGILRSECAHIHVRTLATRHPRTKFVSIVGDKCIPDLPDSRVPMFIVYRKGQIVTQVIAWGSDRERKLEGRFSVSTVYKSRP